jgi:hypothetical protein
LTLTAGEIGEAAPEVEEQGVGVDPRFAAKVELDPVARSQVDELRKTREARQIDQVLSREIRRQRGRRQLVHVHGSIRGADDADSIQTQCLPAGFYDTTRRDSVTEG